MQSEDIYKDLVASSFACEKNQFDLVFETQGRVLTVIPKKHANIKITSMVLESLEPIIDSLNEDGWSLDLRFIGSEEVFYEAF